MKFILRTLLHKYLQNHKPCHMNITLKYKYFAFSEFLFGFKSSQQGPLAACVSTNTKLGAE